MSNISITNNDIAGVVIASALTSFKDELLTFTGAGTVPAGTILARDTSTLKLVPFVKGGTTDGNGVPNTVLTQPATATAAGDVPVRPLFCGQVRTSKLIIAADGDASNVDATVLDQLRVYSIEGLTVDQIAELDNQ